MSQSIEEDPIQSATPGLAEEERRQSDRRQGERRRDLRERNLDTLHALLEISNHAGSDLEIDEILAHIVEITTRAMAAQSCSVYLWNEDRTRLVMRCNLGLEPSLVGVASFERGHGIPGWVAERGETLALADGSADPRYDPLPSTLSHDFHAYLCSPLHIGDNVLGALVLRRNDVHEWSDEEITTYETICNQVAMVIEKARVSREKFEAEKLAAVAVSLSGVAHYIKNLLTTMKGGEFLLESGLKRDDMAMVKEGWGALKRSNAKIRDLVENMLSYYRGRETHPRPVELNSYLLEILNDLEDRAMERRTVLTPDLDMRLEKVEIDPDAMQDVMINLITNAIDAIPEGAKGVVQVGTRLVDDGRRVKITVKDNGLGIPEEHQAKLFNLFFSTKGKKGTGIGLAASRKMVHLHQGEIDFETTPGVGTTFTITIPVTQPRG